MQMQSELIFVLLVSLTASQSVPASFTFAYGGRDWANTCATGNSQSPVTIPTTPTNPAQAEVVSTGSDEFSEVLFLADTQPFAQFSSGGFLLYPSSGTVSATVNGVYFEGSLSQFHFHAPGEHLFDGMRYPVELHIVFNPTLNDTGIAALEIAVMFIEGDQNEFVDGIINQQAVDLVGMLQGKSLIDDYYTYSGSSDVPVPDCIEDFVWILPNFILQMSPAQVQFYMDKYVNDLTFSNGHGAYRDIQPLNGRTIYHVKPDFGTASFLG